jgi:hypothetical protein
MARIMLERDAMGRAARARAIERFKLGDWFDRHQRVFEHLLVQKASA